jgi:hypothetical protein
MVVYTLTSCPPIHLIPTAVNRDCTEGCFDADGELVVAAGTCFVVIGKDAAAAVVVSKGVAVAAVQGFEVVAPVAGEQDWLAGRLLQTVVPWVEVGRQRRLVVDSLLESKHIN